MSEQAEFNRAVAEAIYEHCGVHIDVPDGEPEPEPSPTEIDDTRDTVRSILHCKCDPYRPITCPDGIKIEALTFAIASAAHRAKTPVDTPATACPHKRTLRHNTSGIEADTIWCEDCGAMTDAESDEWTLPAHRPAPWADVAVTLPYTNHKGKRRERTFKPLRLWFGATEYHPVEQWLIHGYDCDKDAERDYPLFGFAVESLNHRIDPNELPDVDAKLRDDPAFYATYRTLLSVCRTADESYEKANDGGTKAWLREHFFPALMRAGLQVTPVASPA